MKDEHPIFKFVREAASDYDILNPWQRRADDDGMPGGVSYTAVVLDDASHDALVEATKDMVPDGWEIIAHHMTINMGPANEWASQNIGEEFSLVADSFAIDDKVAAVGISTDAESDNSIKHVTVGVNRAGGGKPFMSNSLKEWNTFGPVQLKGFVTEVPYQ